MQDNTIQCNLKNAMLSNYMQYHTILYNYHTEPRYTMQYRAIPYITLKYHLMQYNTIPDGQYHEILYNPIQYSGTQ